MKKPKENQYIAVITKEDAPYKDPIKFHALYKNNQVIFGANDIIPFSEVAFWEPINGYIIKNTPITIVIDKTVTEVTAIFDGKNFITDIGTFITDEVTFVHYNKKTNPLYNIFLMFSRLAHRNLLPNHRLLTY